MSVLLFSVAMLFAQPIRAVGQANVSPRSAAAEPVYLVIRTDDAGMSHSVNTGIERLIKTGLPVSVSVMFPTPWYQETVDLLKGYPAVSVGIHLTLNSEWKNYRWGPVAGRSAVPSLVDSDGYFFASSADLQRNGAKLSEIETELRAQIERARRSGLRIDYVDYHMGTLVLYPEYRDLTERLAREFGFGMSGYFGEAEHDSQYWAAPRQKTDSLLAIVRRLQPRFNLLVTHVGMDDPELGALVDMNTSNPLPEMSRNRQGELDALSSARLKKALKARNIQLITYRQLIEMQGLQAMRRPVG